MPLWILKLNPYAYTCIESDKLPDRDDPRWDESGVSGELLVGVDEMRTGEIREVESIRMTLKR